jgi:trimeric autotransporter adhesin
MVSGARNHRQEFHMSTASFSIPVPSSGFGAAVDVSGLVGEKTVALSGRYRGAYVLYGSHDGTRFAPLLIFNAGGIEGIKQTFRGSFAWLKLKSLATGASGVSAAVSGLSVAGDNSFTSLGVGTVLDLGNDLYQVDLNFMGFGQVNGAVVVEGSLDGFGFNPIGEFASTQAGASLLGGGSGIEFSPVATNDRVRYVRLNVQGSAESGFVVTVGGAQSESGGTGGSETLAAAYSVGVSSVDQTMVMKNSKGGKVVFDGSDPGFTDDVVVQVTAHGGGVAGLFLRNGGMELGPLGIQIGEPGFPALTLGGAGNVAIGLNAVAHIGYDTRQVVMGMEAEGDGHCAVALGGSDWISFRHTQAIGDFSVAVGGGAQCKGDSTIAVGPLSYSQSTGANPSCRSVAIGANAQAWGETSAGLVVIGENAVAGSSSIPLNGCVVIGCGAQASGSNATAIGCNAGVNTISGNRAIAIGDQALAQTDYSLSIGPSTHTSGPADTVLGVVARTEGTGGWNVVIGNQCWSRGMDAVVIGDSASAVLGINMIAIGVAAHVEDTLGYGAGVAIGAYSASDSSSVSLGGGAASAAGGISVGCPAIGLGQLDVVVGLGSQTLDAAGGNVVLGSGGRAVGQSNVVIGTSANAVSGGGFFGLGVAIGYNASSGVEAVAIGPSANALYSAVAIGETTITGSGSVSIGFSATSLASHINQVAVGNNATANGNSSIAIGSLNGVSDNPVAEGDFDIVIGTGSTTGAGGSNSMAMGHGATTAGNDSISIGTLASCSAPEITGAGQGIAIGFGAHVFMANSIGIGARAHAGLLSEQNIVIGADSSVGDEAVHSNNILVGISAAASCDSSVLIGGSATIGDATIASTAGVAVGPSSSCFGNYDVALGSGAAVGTNFPVVTPFDYGTALGCNSYVLGEQGLAVGCSATVMGDNGIAIGFSAMAGAGEIVFSSVLAGGANKFEVVGSTAGNPDLFSFDSGALGVDNITSLTLLVRRTGVGSIAALPVLLGPSDGTYSVLRVANP